MFSEYLILSRSSKVQIDLWQYVGFKTLSFLGIYFKNESFEIFETGSFIWEKAQSVCTNG